MTDWAGIGLTIIGFSFIVVFARWLEREEVRAELPPPPVNRKIRR